MKLSATINRRAWRIRRNAAQRQDVPITSIAWQPCLQQAKESSIEYLDQIVDAHSAFDSFEHLLNCGSTYNPTIIVDSTDKVVLANAYDHFMTAFQQPNRAYRSLICKRVTKTHNI